MPPASSQLTPSDSPTPDSPPSGPSGAADPRTVSILKGFYFFAFAGLGALFPLLAVMLSRRGLSPQDISWVMVLIPLSNMLIPTLWGTVADAFHRRIGLLRLSAAGSALGPLLLLPHWGLAGSMVAVGVFSFFRAPLTPMADASAVDALDGKSAEFSRIRLWGSVGFAVLVLLVGQLDGSSHPSLLLGITAGMYAVATLLTLPMKKAKAYHRERVLGEVASVARRADVVLFLLGNVAYYGAHAINDAYFGLHVKGLGVSDSFIGRGWALGVATEIAVMLLAPKVLPRWKAKWVLLACAGVSVVRWGGMSLFQGPWAILGLQALHGLTFGLWYLSIVRFMQDRAPQRLRTSLQTLAMSAIGLGMTGGYLLGGRLFSSSGAPYWLATALAGVAALLYLAVTVATDSGTAGDSGLSAEAQEH